MLEEGSKLLQRGMEAICAYLTGKRPLFRGPYLLPICLLKLKN